MPPDAVSFEDIDGTQALERRALRVRDPVGEARAMDELKVAVAGSPRAVLRKLTDVALTLCEAQSAGVSLLEESGGRLVFRWHAVSGEWSHLLWNTLPREASPCGTVLDRQGPLLMLDPERCYPALGQVRPRVAEVLLVPFSVDGELVGTLWVISHDGSRQFDREDRRVVTALTRFAADAYGRLKSFKPEDVSNLSRMHHLDAGPGKKPGPGRADS